MTNQVKIAGNNAAERQPKPAKKKKIASLDRRKARAGWLFVLPFIIGFIVIYIPIIYESIKYSFFNYRIIDGMMTKEFVGWQHYSNALFSKTDFVQTLLLGLKEMIFNIPAILIFSLFIAVVLNQKMVGRAAFRVIFFLPVVVSTGIMESILRASYVTGDSSMDLGMAESTTEQVASSLALEKLLMRVFESLGFGEGMVTYIAQVVGNIANIVNRSGVQILIFLAALQSISPAIYESCQIDGATSWETFWKITFPMVSPMILVNGVYTIIDNFTTDSNSVMNVINATFTDATAEGAQHVSSAMGWMYFLLVLAVVGILAAILSAFVFYQRRD